MIKNTIFHHLTTHASFGTAPEKKIAAIIPAFNEDQSITSLLEILKETDCLHEIIVVDDGSTDLTAEAALQAARSDPRIRVLRHETNFGKGRSLLTGCQAAQSPYLLFLDADLKNLTPKHIQALAAPVLQGSSDMTVGVFKGGRWATDFSHQTTPWLSGQRCLRSDLIHCVSSEAAQGYGMETALTIAARQQLWRCQEVRLKGLSNTANELHQGLGKFFRKRIKIFSDIGRAMHLTGGWRFFIPRIRIEVRLVVILLLLLLASTLAFNRSRAASPLNPADIPILDLTEVVRLLVISPHPDDEVLGAGGLIQAALAQGASVKVVMLTNGDGQVFIPLSLNRSVRTGLRDFVAYGEHRQVETLEALKELGLSEEYVVFLGYPDRSLLNLWLGNWDNDCPVTAIFTRAVYTPYKNSYNPTARYCGNDILNDIRSIIEDYLPDLVVIPHPNDDHPDHRAAANFTRLALSLVQKGNPEYQSSVISYLIHYGQYPQPRGRNFNKPLSPPAPLSGSQNAWYRLDLPAHAIQQKMAALNKYPTQLRLLGNFLPSFARPNELFMALPSGKVMPLEFSVLPLHEKDAPELSLQDLKQLNFPGLAEPANENASRFLLAGTDLVGWKVARLGDQLILTADARGPLIPGLQYRILIKTPEGRTTIYIHNESGRFSLKRSFTAHIDLAELGNPGVISFAADVQQGLTLERTGWYFIELQDWLEQPLLQFE
jgi:LmbE family N-acetylglucosaminyl deacetylase